MLHNICFVLKYKKNPHIPCSFHFLSRPCKRN
nr:MAG TPA: hypothetical protein [Caudoviricetes sp.]